ncbi:hypothetical protein [Lichenicoccus sp.]|uniref:hypothetical protein n=1 Tax=Lichenicoccus sp. TaxID=2781899 RepID=UPI003D10A73C
MHVSSAGKSSDNLDAHSLLLNSVLSGSDAILIGEGSEADVLLESVATCLAGLRSRILRAAEVLPGSLRTPSPPKTDFPDDQSLIRDYQALTVLDQTCDRIVLLVSDAHLLLRSALRYIQFVSRSGPRLQLIFCGSDKLFDLLKVDEFAWLRARLMAGLIVTVPAASVKTTAGPRSSLPRPTFVASMSSRKLRLAALALLVAGGASYLELCLQSGTETGSLTSGPAPIQPAPPQRMAMVTQHRGGLTSRVTAVTSPATPNAAVLHPSALAGEVGPALLASRILTPSSMTASKRLATAWPRAQIGSLSLAGQGNPAEASNAVDAVLNQSPTTLRPPIQRAPTKQVSHGFASHPDLAVSLAAKAAAQHQAALTGNAPGPEQKLSSSLSARPPVPVHLKLAMALPPVKAGVLRSEPKLRRPQPVRTAAMAQATLAHRRKPVREQVVSLPTKDDMVAPQPASTSGNGPHRYIGSYTTDADGVRMFHLDP